MSRPAWQGSTRRSRLPRDWAHRRAVVLKRDPTCMRCHRAPSTEVDHVRPGDDHRYENLQGLCESCHKAKTQAEKPKPAPRRRPPEPHPGLIR